MASSETARPTSPAPACGAGASINDRRPGTGSINIPLG